MLKLDGTVEALSPCGVKAWGGEIYCELGVAVYDSAKALLGLFHLPLSPVSVAEIVVRGGGAGISRQSLLVRRNRVVETILC